MCDRPGTPFIKNVKLRSLKGKEPATPIDTFSKDILEELYNIEDKIQTGSLKRKKLPPIDITEYETSNDQFLVFENKYRPPLHFNKKKNYQLEDVLKILKNLDKVWQDSQNEHISSIDHMTFYVS